MKLLISKAPLITLVAFLFLSPNDSKAQISSGGIFFQGIARDNMSNPAKDRKIFIQTTIIQNNPSGTAVLTELHEANTDASGIFSISIGQGQRIAGSVSSLTDIPWANGPFYLNLKIAISPIAPLPNWNYTKEWIDLGSTPFGTVPYALYAGKVAGLENKLNISDTSAMLANYAKTVISLIKTSTNSINNTDSINIILKNKLNISDSINAYVTPTQLKGKTFDTLSLSYRIDGKLNISDTSNLLNSYLKVNQLESLIVGKLSKNDTSAMLSSYLDAIRNLQNIKLN